MNELSSRQRAAVERLEVKVERLSADGRDEDAYYEALYGALNIAREELCDFCGEYVHECECLFTFAQEAP